MSKQKVNCAKGTREADLGHAVLSASGSHRWLNCTPSARLELEFENTTSEAAREGTAAHALCEHKLKKFLKKRSKRPVSDYNSDEMEECTDAYAEFVMEQYEEAKKSCKDPVILIEQKLKNNFDPISSYFMCRRDLEQGTASSFPMTSFISLISNMDKAYLSKRNTTLR